MIANLIGWLVSSRVGFALLKAYATRRHHTHLYDPDGSLYMGRWRVVDDYKLDVYGRDTTERGLASRVLEKLTGFTAIRLHHIARPDRDRDRHNHPFTYRTFIAKGWYREETDNMGATIALRADGYLLDDEFFTQVNLLEEGDTGLGSPDKYHRIVEVSLGGVWTLFCMTENTKHWGFRVDGKHMDSKRYFVKNKYPKETIKAVHT